jgi:hypothetical protein
MRTILAVIFAAIAAFLVASVGATYWIANQAIHKEEPTALDVVLKPTVRIQAQEHRLRLKRPKSVFCNSLISRNLWTCGPEITQLYRTFLADLGPEVY